MRYTDWKDKDADTSWRRRKIVLPGEPDRRQDNRYNLVVVDSESFVLSVDKTIATSLNWIELVLEILVPQIAACSCTARAGQMIRARRPCIVPAGDYPLLVEIQGSL
jgi:hypothetical protein